MSKESDPITSREQIMFLFFRHSTSLAVKDSLSFETDRPVTYHIVLRDCGDKFSTEYFDRKTILKVSLDIKNDGK